jgi:hypothetical protein
VGSVLCKRHRLGAGSPGPAQAAEAAETTASAQAEPEAEAAGPTKKRVRASKKAAQRSSQPRARKPRTVPAAAADQAPAGDVAAPTEDRNGSHELLPGAPDEVGED